MSLEDLIITIYYCIEEMYQETVKETKLRLRGSALSLSGEEVFFRVWIREVLVFTLEITPIIPPPLFTAISLFLAKRLPLSSQSVIMLRLNVLTYCTLRLEIGENVSGA